MLVGILSDTHRIRPDDRFRRSCQRCFADCPVIIHAGDLTDVAILEVFRDKEVYAVHGNMCTDRTRQVLPDMRSFRIRGYGFGLIHGAGLGPDRVGTMIGLFPDADCIISGHTHEPFWHWYGRTLFVNPGSFFSTGPYGAQGTYAVLQLGETLKGSIREVPLEGVER